MRQIDEIHNAEHERQAGGNQEQDQTKLDAVEQLIEKKSNIHPDASQIKKQ